MNLLFLTLVEINSIEDRGIYQDLLRKFRDEGHEITIVSPLERRKKLKTRLISLEGVSYLQVRTLNIQKTNIIEKGIGTIAIEYQFLNAIKQNLGHKKFDLILYSTPPITLIKIIKYVKSRDDASTYLLLKDIFPQNAVDLNLLRRGSIFHRFFRAKEMKLYEISDTIGCMSPANVQYLVSHNPQISKSKIEINPNCIEPIDINYSRDQIVKIRQNFSIPLDKRAFVYGGNLGKPQGLDFLLETIQNTEIDDVYFVIVGDGTEFQRLKEWFEKNKPKNSLLLSRLNKDQFDELIAACDVGMIFLNRNFTIPNFPSRLLSYLEMRMPVIAAVDDSTDLGQLLVQKKCGFNVQAGNLNEMKKAIEEIIKEPTFLEMKNNAWKWLISEFHVDRAYRLIMEKAVSSN